VAMGKYHHAGCDVERCPACKGQQPLNFSAS
jgi:hypothetical protein